MGVNLKYVMEHSCLTIVWLLAVGLINFFLLFFAELVWLKFESYDGLNLVALGCENLHLFLYLKAVL